MGRRGESSEGTAALGMGLLQSLAATHWNRRPPLPALFSPLGSLLFAAMMLRSGWLGWRRGGLVWRDTFSPRDLLIEGRRLRMM